MTIKRFGAHLLDQSSATDGQGLVWDNATGLWVPGNVVRSITAGTNVTVDNTDPLHPVVAASGSATVFSGCRVRRTTNTTLSAGAWSFFAGWDAETFDTNSYHDNSTNNTRLTVPSTGYYHMSVHLPFTVAASAQVAVGFVLNTDAADKTIVRADNSAGFGSAGASGVYRLTAGDYVRVSYYCQTGTPTVASGTTGAAYASIHLVGT